MRGLRKRVVLAVLVVVTIAFAAVILGFNLVLANRLSHDADDVLQARASAELASLTTTHGRLTVREAPERGTLESDAWVFAGRRLLEGPRSRPEIYRAVASLAGGPGRRVELSEQDVRLLARPVEARGRRVGTVVAGISLVPYEHTERVALVSSLVLMAVLLGVVALVAWRIVALALRPVAQMTAQAAEWSEHDLDRRFALGEPHDELTELARTLDHLLDRVAASLRHEQRFSSEMSHELRTPLTKVRAEAELALRQERTSERYREALRRVLEAADQMERIMETLLLVAREDADARHGTTDPAEAARRAVASCADLARSRGIEIAVSEPERVERVAGDVDLVERILVPVIENACRYGRTMVTVSLARRDGEVTYTVRDDGPGVTEGEADGIFEPGVRGSAGQNGDGLAGAGLGLALARRLARAAHGDIEAHPDATGGRFTIALPAG